jgi:hypothetical protein
MPDRDQQEGQRHEPVIADPPLPGARPMKARPALLRALLLAGLGLLALVSVASIWLRQTPELLPGLLNAWLPPGVLVRELRGPRLSLYGASADVLELDAAGTIISLRGVSWTWGIDRWLPLQIAPQSMTLRGAQVRMGQASAQSTGARLSRFWQQSWWPRLAAMRVEIDKLELQNHAGEPLLETALAVREGGQRGSASLQSRSMPDLELAWQPLDDARLGWLLQWRSAMPYPAQGVLALHPSAAGVDWTLKAHASPWQLGQQQVRELQLQARGSSDLFDGDAPLLQARIDVGSRLGLPAAGAEWQCQARLELAQAGSGTASIDHCLGAFAGGSIRLDAALMLDFDDALTAQAVSTTGGRAELEGLELGGWTLTSAVLELQPGMLQQAPDTAWKLPRVGFDAVLASGPGDRLQLKGTLQDAVLREQSWRAALAATLHARRGTTALAALAVQAGLHGDGDSTQGSGSIRHQGIGQLAQFEATIKHANARYRASLTLDSHQWNWGEGLLGALLGEDQALVPAELLGGEIRAVLRVDNNAGPMRIRGNGSALRVFGMAGGYGMAGLDIESFDVELTDGRVTRFDPLAWTLDSAHAGIGLNRLNGTLLHAQDGWHLQEVGGEVLGGSFSLPSFGALGSATASGRVQLSGIDLAQVGRLIDTPGLSLEGKVDATLPVFYRAGTLTVSDGRVRNAGAGLIRYRPPDSAAIAGKEMALAQRALSNLSLESLDATLQYDAQGLLTLLTEVRGRNPELDAKRPVHLNLTLETNLRTLLQSMRAGNAVGAWLEKRM